MNVCIMMGRLTADPEIRYSQNGTGIAKFTIAVDRRFKKEGQPEADFHNCTCFGRLAEFTEKYLHKGIKIVVNGELQDNNYTNRNGEKVYSKQLILNSIEFAESKSSSDQANNRPAHYQQPDKDGFMNIPDGIDEELPFT